jgi:hypothetical protein
MKAFLNVYRDRKSKNTYTMVNRNSDKGFKILNTRGLVATTNEMKRFVEVLLGN